jgi:phospholipid/cholesterol/gamma-HCH transport system permease protein
VASRRRGRRITPKLTTQGTEVSAARLDDGTLVVRLQGSWVLEGGIPSADPVIREISTAPLPARVAFDASELEEWDSSLLAFARQLAEAAEAGGIRVDSSGLPPGARRLMDLAVAVPERADARRSRRRERPLARLGQGALGFFGTTHGLIEFIGLTSLSFLRLLVGRAKVRGRDFWLFVQEAGADALPIVSLISFLIGVILAFIGALQLRQFGAIVWTANIVAIGMVRYLGPMMTAIIMAGRTGASYAAQLGTMTANEEVDALRTLGISPIDFLVLPRTLALVLMMPLLALYADFVGMLGGAVIGTLAFGIGTQEYISQTQSMLTMKDFLSGLNMAASYGVLIAIAGCFRGMSSGRSAAAVGDATTRAVVMAIVLIVIATAFWTVLYDILGI